MMRFIEKPNLPDGRVSRIICGEIPYEIKCFLGERRVDIIDFNPNSLIDASVSTHADMCALHIGGNRVVVDKNQTKLAARLQNLGFSVTKTKEDIAGEYPSDVKLNVALFGRNAIGAFSHSDETVVENISDYNKFEVKQGYTKCSVLPVSENALITDDVSVYKTLRNAFDMLLIDKGDIVLEGHEYGFIGGASAKISTEEVLFFGDIKKHRNCKEILDFLDRYNCNAISFDGLALTDVGGVVSLCEYI